MSSQQNSSIPTEPYSFNSVPINFESNAFEQTPLLCQTSTIEQAQCQPDWEDVSQVNPWVLPTRDIHFKPLPSSSSSYFSTLYSRSMSWHMLESSPTESITKTGFTPSLASNELNHLTIRKYMSNSDGGSDLLTPPISKKYTDLPPYKPRTSDSSSLTMAKLRRIRSTSFGDRDSKRRRRLAQSNKNRQTRGKDLGFHSSWWHGSCQVARQGSEYYHIYQSNNNVPFRNSDQYGINFPSIESSRASTFMVVQSVTRRWSCIEFRGESKVKCHVPCKTASLVGPANFMDQLASKHLETRCTTPGARNNDIIEAIRETLTTRKVPSPEVPDLITLRRATVSKNPGIMEAVDVGLSTKDSDTSSEQDEAPESYIITKSDINAITDLVRAALNDDSQPVGPHLKNGLPVGQMPRAPTFTRKGLVVGAGTAVESVVSSAEVKLCLRDNHQPPNFLHVVTETSVAAPTLVLPSKKSMHEVIWEGNISPSSSDATSPTKSAASFDDAEDVIAPEHDFPTPLSVRMPCPAQYFDPDNLSPEKMNQWPFRSPRDEVNFIFPSPKIEESPLEFVAPPITPPIRPSRPTLKSQWASMKVPQVDKPLLSPVEWSRKDSLQDVLSFPPLPTRNSNDWYSPLPPVDTPTPVSLSLYDIGLDVHCGPSTPDPWAHQGPSPQASRTSWIRSAECSLKVSKVPSIAFNPEYEVCQSYLEIPRTKVPILEQTLTVDEPTKLSSSAPHISDFVSEVTQGIQRVKTIDNVHKGERPGHWSPYRPPSIYPTAVTPSPSERSTDEEKQLSAKTGNKPSNLKASIDSLDLLHSTSPVSPGTPWPAEEGMAQLCGMAGHRSDHVCDDCAMDPRFLD